MLLGITYGAAYCLMLWATVNYTVGWAIGATFIFCFGVAFILLAGIAAGLASKRYDFRHATLAVIVIGAAVGWPFYSFDGSSNGYAVALPAGLAAGITVMTTSRDGGNPSRGIRWRLLRGVLVGLTAGAVVTILNDLAAGGSLNDLAAGYPSIALPFGLAVGLGATVLVGLERVPGDLKSASSPSAVLRRDRSTATTLALVTSIAAGLAIGVGQAFFEGNFGIPPSVPRLHGLIFGFCIGPAVGFIFTFAISGYGSVWPPWVITRALLAAQRLLPWRLMTFLEDAHERGALRQVGPVYQFRHLELQHRLADQGRIVDGEDDGTEIVNVDS
jgi:hypothetical protein